MTWYRIIPIFLVLFWGAVGCAKKTPPEPPKPETPIYATTPTEEEEGDDPSDAKNPKFDDVLTADRLLDGRVLNLSGSVLRLDCPPITSGSEFGPASLNASHMQAEAVVKMHRRMFLPSASFLASAAAQFDDGVLAALALANFQGDLGFSSGALDVTREVFSRLPERSPARPFLAAALELAQRDVRLAPEQEAERQRYLTEFRENGERRRPANFEEWRPELQRMWRFRAFLGREFDERDLRLCRDIAAVLADDADLRRQCRAIREFSNGVNNAPACLPVDALANTKAPLAELTKHHGVARSTVALFPAPLFRETVVFHRVFPDGPPDDVNLMSGFIEAIRRDDVNQTPRKQDGWYQQKAFASEALLRIPDGAERDKLLRTAAYKRFQVDSFKTVLTGQRESHFGLMPHPTQPAEAVALRQGRFEPRLRIEPRPTFYLRMARSYAFLEKLLVEKIGRDRLGTLRAFRADGRSPNSLASELREIRRRFYGFYLISCEDIGLKPAFETWEKVDRETDLATALRWLESIGKRPELAADGRILTPVYYHPKTGAVRVWANAGVRLVPLDVMFTKPPKVRAKAEESWRDVESWHLTVARYYLSVDEPIELELPNPTALNQKQFRDVCDGAKEKPLRESFRKNAAESE